MRKIGLVFTILVLLSACSINSAETVTPNPTVTATPDAVREEEGVYAALLEARYPSELLVIMQMTQTDVIDLASEETYKMVGESLQHLATETLLDFKARNDNSYPLKASMILGTRYLLFSEKDMQDLFQINQSGWDVFYNRYPEAPGIITLSRVGFNEQMDQALVYLGIQSHWLAGSGNFFLLNKIDGVWVIDQQVMTWVS
jgi:hypothetical protein